MKQEEIKRKMGEILDLACKFRKEKGREPPMTFIGWQGEEFRKMVVMDLPKWMIEQLIRQATAAHPPDVAMMVCGAWQVSFKGKEEYDKHVASGKAVREVEGAKDIVFVSCKTNGGRSYRCSRIVEGAGATDTVEWHGFGEAPPAEGEYDRFLDVVQWRNDPAA